MRILTDQDVYASTVRYLRGLGHDVVTASELGLAQAEDLEILRVAEDHGRVFVSRDRDFGGLVFLGGSTTGVIYLRILPSTEKAVHNELERVLAVYDERELRTMFVVVEPGRHRVRKPRASGGPEVVP
jgi:predicted nuclease of predicted toxin-antitoxin system